MSRTLLSVCSGLLLAALMMAPHVAAQEYDLLLKGGHVIDDKNHIDAVRDVAIKDGKIAKVGLNIPSSSAIKTVNVTGLYVTPGLIDMHVHVFWGEQKNSYGDGDWGLNPDGFTFRVGVTTVVDAGSSGWRDFPAFKDRVIDRSETRVLAFLNILGSGMRPWEDESNQADMDGKLTGEMAKKFPGVIVGIKTAHYTGPEWTPVEQAVLAGNIANIPVMVDFGTRRLERPLSQLLEEKLRPGDILTHMYSNGRGEQDPVTGGPGAGMREGRARGIIYDVGMGSGSLYYTIAIPLVKEGFVPDSISTDLHIRSMNAGMKDILTIAEKFLEMGIPLKDVIADMTWHPAREIKQYQLGSLTEGGIGDVTVLAIRHGEFGSVDGGNMVMKVHRRFECELTIKDGKIVYDRNGRSADPWDLPPSAAGKQANKWTTLHMKAYTDIHPSFSPQKGAPVLNQKFPPIWEPYDRTLPDGTFIKGGTLPKSALPLTTNYRAGNKPADKPAATKTTTTPAQQ